MRLSEQSIKAIAATDREQVVWDVSLSGFGLRVQPTGAKSFIVMYRTAGGRRGRVRKVTIGRYGDRWTYLEARKEAKRILALVELQKDPAAERRAHREALTISELCDLYFSEGCETKKPSTLVTDRGRVARHIKPLLGRLKVAEVTRADIERFMRDVAAGKTADDVKTVLRGRAIVRGGRGTASRTVGLLGGILSFALNRGLRADNPARGVPRFKDRKGERYLSAEEWAMLGEGLAKADAERANPTALAIIRALALTGGRKSEMVTLRWSEVDFENGRALLGDSKTGAKAIALGAPALQLLASQPRPEGATWVFPGERSEGPFGGLDRVWRQVRVLAGLPNLRLHDLRHAFASRGLAAGFGLPIIGALLGHKDAKTTNRYAHLADDPVNRAADRIAAEVAGALAFKRA